MTMCGYCKDNAWLALHACFLVYFPQFVEAEETDLVFITCVCSTHCKGVMGLQAALVTNALPAPGEQKREELVKVRSIYSHIRQRTTFDLCVFMAMAFI